MLSYIHFEDATALLKRSEGETGKMRGLTQLKGRCYEPASTRQLSAVLPLYQNFQPNFQIATAEQRLW